MAAAPSSVSAYKVASAVGLDYGKRHFDLGATLLLTSDQAQYLLLSGAILPAANVVLAPNGGGPPVVGPVTPVETNTLISLTISGLTVYVTLENLVNLFPRLQPARGLKGDEGDEGPKGDRGDPGPAVVVNGIVPSVDGVLSLSAHDVGAFTQQETSLEIRTAVSALSDSLTGLISAISSGGGGGGSTDLGPLAFQIASHITNTSNPHQVTKAQVGLGSVANLAPADLPVSTATAAAIASVSQALANLTSVVTGAPATLDTFLEVYNRFLSDETAAAALTALVGTKASQADLLGLAIDVLDGLSGKADVQDLLNSIASVTPLSIGIVDAGGHVLGDAGTMTVVETGGQSARMADALAAKSPKVISDPAKPDVSRLLFAKVRERHVSISDLGAFGGDAEKDTAALEAAVLWCNGPNGDGRGPYIPPGRGSIKRTINHFSTFTGGADVRRAGLEGEASGKSQLVWVGPASSGNMINWGTLSTDPSQGQYNSHCRIGRFTLDGAGLISTGLRAFRQAWFLMEDIRLTGFTGAALHSESCVAYSIRGMRSFLSSTGALFDKGSDPTSFTTPNAIKLDDCTFGSHTFAAIDAVDCGPLILSGGNIEGCGSSSTSPGGIRITKTGLNLGIESIMLSVHGTYFENNYGKADIDFINASAIDVGIAIQAANFNRVSSSRFTKNNILMELLGSGSSSLDVGPCGFNTAGSYVRDASRPVIDFVGDGNRLGNVRRSKASVGDKGVDAPTIPSST